MMNHVKKMVALGMAVIMMAGTCVVPAKAEVISGLDTAEETFFSSSSGTSSDLNSSTDNFFDSSSQTGASENTTGNGNSGNTGSTDSTVVVPSTPAPVESNTTTTSNSNNSNVYYYYYTTPTTTTTTPAQTTEKTENVTLNGTSQSQQSQTEVVKVSLKKPQIAAVVSKKKAAVVCLKAAVANADGYQIQFCKSKTFKKDVTQLRTVLTTKNVKTNASGTFYVRVRAYKIVSGKTYYSGWSSVKSVKIK